MIQFDLAEVGVVPHRHVAFRLSIDLAAVEPHLQALAMIDDDPRRPAAR